MLRRILGDPRADENENPPATSPSSTEGEASVPAPPTGPAEPDPNGKKRQGLAEFLHAALDQQMAQIKALLAEALPRLQDTESCLQIAAQCQKEMSAIANGLLERHALYPAVETVDFLSSLIGQLSEQALSLAGDQTHCPLFKPLLDSVAEAAKIAKAKREYLDMEAICPQPLDGLNLERHEIRQAVPTEDAARHKQVERTLVPGLVYRGTVLRRAKVSVYKHAEKDQ